jgi:hypothetical protein
MAKPIHLVAAGLTTIAALTGGAIGFLGNVRPQPQPVNVTRSPEIAAAPASKVNASPSTEPISEVSPQPTTVPTKKQRPMADDRCEVTMAKVMDPDPPLNVRSSPDSSAPNITGQLNNGIYVTIEAETSDWYKITSPQSGWIAKSKTKHGCSHRTERLTANSTVTGETVIGEFIGTGDHIYILKLESGQTLTIQPTQGPRPGLVDPGGKMIQAMEDDRSSLIIPIKTSGDYRIDLASQYKGYTYEFTVEVK